MKKLLLPAAIIICAVAAIIMVIMLVTSGSGRSFTPPPFDPMFLSPQAMVILMQAILNSMPQATLPQRTAKQTYGLQTPKRITSGSRHVCLIKTIIFSEKAAL